MTRTAGITLTLTERERYVDVDSFVTAARALTAILRELDGAVSRRGVESLRWGVGTFQAGSAVLAAVPIPTDGDVVEPRTVIAACVGGLHQLEESARIPPYFTDKALQEAKALVGPLQREVRRIAVRGADQEAVVTQHLAANVDAILDRGYTGLGSVEGRLESVSIHDRSVFGLWEPLDGRRVECRFPMAMLDEVREALGRRVSVRGMVRFGKGDQPVSVEVEHIRLFPAEEDLPTTEQLRGLDPDFTGGVDSTTYVRGLYDA